MALPSLSPCTGYNAPVGIVVTKNGLPLSNVTVSFSSSFTFITGPAKNTSTNTLGLAQGCFPYYYAVEALLQKPGENLGSGVGEWHRVAVSGPTRGMTPYLFPPISIIGVPSVPDLPPLPDVCALWKTVEPKITLPTIPMMPTTSSFPISISGAKWECPSLNQVEPINGVAIVTMGPTLHHPISFEMNLKNGSNTIYVPASQIKNIFDSLDPTTNLLEITFNIPIKGGGYTKYKRTIPVSIPYTPPPLPESCTSWATKASPKVPSTMSTAMPISVSSAMWQCLSDISKVESITGMGKIEIAGHSFDFPINNGSGRVNLENLISIPQLIAELRG